ncbi:MULTISPECIES: demethoxyubiquinone hydroxylase family protein [unclassified Duganella]|uniref:demethoxyubiquinone hydroxylase family protein n=1 Tax=unclassified Duganella TaxID=2636909 RepID=UPI001E31EF19|nr:MULTISPECIES: demethoxyubiquinone hydroxylase family protein [unclassified Duganella]
MPADMAPSPLVVRDYANRVLKVNHAGENGAVNIYRGQIFAAHLTAPGGLFLGFVTGLFGRRAIAATTVAVERVVLQHLEKQLLSLRDTDTAAYAAVLSIVEEERLHHDQSAAHLKVGQFWPRVLTPVVAGSTEVVIWLGMRL